MESNKIPSLLLKELESSYGIALITKHNESTWGHGVYLLIGGEKNLIAKRNPHKREMDFFHAISTIDKKLNFCTPKLVWSGHIDDADWIVLETTKINLPESLWEADQNVIQYFSFVHELEMTKVLNSPKKLKWTEDMNLNALGFFKAPQRIKIEDKLQFLREDSQHLFSDSTFIIGNGNPNNLGITNKNKIMAFDWSGYSFASPAIDLSMYICSSENYETSLKVAKIYTELRNHQNINEYELANDILRACVWNYILFLNKIRQKKIDVPEKLVEHILEIFPTWLFNVFDAA